MNSLLLDCVADVNRCRWSCATSVPIGTTPIGSWSSVSSPWSRSWTSWVAASIRPLSCCLRSYVTVTRRSGKQCSQLAVTLHRSANTLQDVVSKTNQLRKTFLFCFAGDMATYTEKDNCLQCSHLQYPWNWGCKSSAPRAAPDSKHVEPLGGLAYLLKISSSGPVLSALHYDS